MQTITSWLQSHGFEVGSTKGRTVLEFSGTAAQVEEAFHTTIHSYLVNGETHWANSTDPQIPAALVPVVAGIKTLHNFLKKPMIHLSEERFPAKLVGKSHPEFTGTTGLHALTPDDYQTIYKAPNAVGGAGAIIAVIGRNDLYNGGQDVTDFRNVLSLYGTTPNVILNGPDPGDAGGSEEAEATLDTSWSGAIAPYAVIDFVVSGSTNTTDGIDLSELYIIENNLGSVMTESFGSCEALTTSTDAQGISLLAEQAAAQGITYIVSAGDTGAEGCDNLSETTAVGGISVNVLASTPFTVAVGGTMFNEHGQDSMYWATTNNTFGGSAVSYIPENVWNETCTTQCQSGQPPLAAGAGGASIYFSKPSWQSGVTGTNSDTVRDIPDISLSAAAHDPYLLCIEGSCQPNSQGQLYFAAVSGTSAAAPSFASVMALVDASYGPQGAANYILYRLASAQQTAGTACNASNTSTLPDSACTFNDVTSGNNSVPGEIGYPAGLYSAATGYDLASGLGSLNVGNLVNNWSTVTFNPTTTTFDLNGNTTAITITHGQAVNVAATVAQGLGSTTPSGDVVLRTGSSVASTLDLFHLSSGQASGSTYSLPGTGSGFYNVWAHYGGDGTYAPSDSNAIPVTVTPEASATTLSLLGYDSAGHPLTSPFPFGSLVFVRADVVGNSGHGIPTGLVTFTDTFGPIPSQNPQFSPPVPVLPNPALNSQGNTSIGDGIVSFDAGNHSVSASYGGDLSFSASNSTQALTFTITPGFYMTLSGQPTMLMKAPGSSGTTSVAITNSSNFTGTITLACSGLPSEATCSFSPASLKANGVVSTTNATVTVSTTAPTTAASLQHPLHRVSNWMLAVGMLFSIVFLADRKQMMRGVCLLVLAATAIMIVSCGGGGSSTPPPPPPNPGTPTGTYNIIVTATSGSAASTTGFTLAVQ